MHRLPSPAAGALADLRALLRVLAGWPQASPYGVVPRGVALGRAWRLGAADAGRRRACGGVLHRDQGRYPQRTAATICVASGRGVPRACRRPRSTNSPSIWVRRRSTASPASSRARNARRTAKSHPASVRASIGKSNGLFHRPRPPTPCHSAPAGARTWRRPAPLAPLPWRAPHQGAPEAPRATGRQ